LDRVAVELVRGFFNRSVRRAGVVFGGRRTHNDPAYLVFQKPVCGAYGGNMIYKVKARVIDKTIGDFYRKLADGTVAKQRPDGEEIVASMKRAVLTGPGVAEWYEMCFCPTPLHHERQTQYDFYFADMTTEPAKEYGEIHGVSLWSYMASKAEAARHAE
jgi:hypothetical protein